MVQKDHEIMSKPLPDILDDIRNMIKEAEGHSEAAKGYALEAKTAARDQVQAEIDKLLPRITEAQGTAGQALKAAQGAQASSDLNTKSILDLIEAIKNLRKDLIDLAKAIVNNLKNLGVGFNNELADYGTAIVHGVSFLTATTKDITPTQKAKKD